MSHFPVVLCCCAGFFPHHLPSVVASFSVRRIGKLKKFLLYQTPIKLESTRTSVLMPLFMFPKAIRLLFNTQQAPLNACKLFPGHWQGRKFKREHVKTTMRPERRQEWFPTNHQIHDSLGRYERYRKRARLLRDSHTLVQKMKFLLKTTVKRSNCGHQIVSNPDVEFINSPVFFRSCSL